MPVEAGERPASSTETCRISWKGRAAHVPCDVKRYGKRIPSTVVVDLKALRLSRHGLLGQVLEALELPCHRKRLLKFLEAVSHLAADKESHDILDTPVELLSGRHINYLFADQEEFVRTHGTWANPSMLSAHFRAYIRRVPARLSCHSAVADVRFRSRFDDPRKVRKKFLISESPDPGAPEGYRDPISTLGHADLAELEARATEHLRVRMQRVEDACWTTLDERAKLAGHIREMKARPLPDFEEVFQARKELEDTSAAALGFRILRLEGRVPADEIATYAWHWIERTCLFERPDEWGRVMPVLSRATRIEQWPDLDDGYCDRESSMFADHILGHRALLVCQYLLQIHGGWNPDTVRALTPASIAREPDGSFIVRPFKPKTDQYLPPRHIGRGDRVHSVIGLLLEHRATVERHFHTDDPSLFIGRQRNLRCFGLFNPKSAHAWFCSRFDIAPFSAGQLRDQKANSLYLSSGRDVLLLKEFLGHADLLSVDTYLNHSIQRVLSEANMAEFIARLDAAVDWAVDGSERPPNPNTAALLFPLCDESADAACDVWLEKEGALEINAEQIAHCVWQRAFYLGNFERLKSENPRRFAVVHLPRIIFCIGLYHVIMQSSYRYLVGRFERLLPGAGAP